MWSFILLLLAILPFSYEKLMNIADVMDSIDLLSTHLDPIGYAETNEFREEQTRIIYKDFDDQLTQFFVELSHIKGILCYYIEDSDQPPSDKLMALPEIELKIKEITRAFDFLVNFYGEAKRTKTLRRIVVEAHRLVEEIFECIQSLKGQIRLALKSNIVLPLRTVMKQLGRHGPLRRFLYSVKM